MSVRGSDTIERRDSVTLDDSETSRTERRLVVTLGDITTVVRLTWTFYPYTVMRLTGLLFVYTVSYPLFGMFLSPTSNISQVETLCDSVGKTLFLVQ